MRARTVRCGLLLFLFFQQIHQPSVVPWGQFSYITVFPSATFQLKYDDCVSNGKLLNTADNSFYIGDADFSDFVNVKPDPVVFPVDEEKVSLPVQSSDLCEKHQA